MIRHSRNDYWLVPDVNMIAREMTDSSQMKMVVKRVLKLKPLSLLKLVWGNIKNSVDLLKMDFSAGVVLLAELELLKLLEGGEKKKCLVLHNQMVDMALGLSNRKILVKFFCLCDRHGMIPGLLSYNLRFLIKRLSNIKGLPKNLRVYGPLSGENKTTVCVMKMSKIGFFLEVK